MMGMYFKNRFKLKTVIIITKSSKNIFKIMDSSSGLNTNGVQNQIGGVPTSIQPQQKQIKQCPSLQMDRKISLASTKTTDSIEDKKQNTHNHLICKICLAEIDNQKIKKQQLISPCSCSGSMKHVHQQCLRQWLNAIVAKNLKKNNNTYAISCQICKDPYNYDIYHKFKCLDKEEFKEKVKQKKLFVILTALFILFCIAGIIALAYLTFSGKIQNKSTLTTNYSVLAAFGSILLALIVLSILTFVWVCVIKRIGMIKQIKPKEIPIVERVIYNPRQQFGL